jgi:hypothetical protein
LAPFFVPGTDGISGENYTSIFRPDEGRHISSNGIHPILRPDEDGISVVMVFIPFSVPMRDGILVVKEFILFSVPMRDGISVVMVFIPFSVPMRDGISVVMEFIPFSVPMRDGISVVKIFIPFPVPMRDGIPVEILFVYPASREGKIWTVNYFINTKLCLLPGILFDGSSLVTLKEIKNMWIIFSLLAAVSAAVAIIPTKTGVKKVDPILGFTIQAVLIIVVSWSVVFF